MAPKLFYMQHGKSWLGDAAVWWAKDAAGYTADLDKAHVYTEEEVRARRWRSDDIARPKDEVDAMSTRPRRAEGKLPPAPEWQAREKDWY